MGPEPENKQRSRDAGELLGLGDSETLLPASYKQGQGNP